MPAQDSLAPGARLPPQVTANEVRDGSAKVTVFSVTFPVFLTEKPYVIT